MSSGHPKAATPPESHDDDVPPQQHSCSPSPASLPQGHRPLGENYLQLGQRARGTAGAEVRVLCPPPPIPPSNFSRPDLKGDIQIVSASLVKTTMAAVLRGQSSTAGPSVRS